MIFSALAGIQLVGSAASSATTAAHSTAPLVSAAGPTCTITVNEEDGQNNILQTEIDALGPLSNAISPVTICVGPGTFPEQLTIDDTTDLTIVGSGNTSTFLAPSSVSQNGVDLDSGVPAYAIIGAWDDSGLTISELAVEGSYAASSVPGCDAYFGIYYGATSGTIQETTITGINTDNGCQGQNAIYVDTGYLETSTITPESVSLLNNTVTGYGKNGITCDDVGVTCDVEYNTVATTSMPLGYAATNGIQFWGAVGSISDNSVSGNVFLPGSCLDQNYFSTGAGCVSPYWASGILILNSPTVVDISDNTVYDNQVGIWSLATLTEAWGNSITEWGYYGIVLDFSYSDSSYLSPITATASVDTGIAEANLVSDQNVGILAYDNNATIVGNTFSNVNVSIEVPVDLSIPSVDNVSFNSGDANVSGALLGDISSYQSGDIAAATASFVSGWNAFATTGTAPNEGIGVYGANAWLNDSTVAGFPSGISAVVSPTGNVFAEGNTITSPSTAVPGSGMYVYADTATIESNTISGYSYATGPGWWPDTQAAGLFVQCLGACTVTDNTLDDNGIGIAVLSYGYGPSPAPSWPYVAPPSAGPITVTDNTVTESVAFGIAFELNQFTSSPTLTPSVSVTGNTVDNSLSGAVGLMVDQGTYAIVGNTFVGTASGPSQETCTSASIGPASVQVLDACDSITVASVESNSFLDTALYYTVLNITTAPPYFANLSGVPPLSSASAPTVSASLLDVDQGLTVTGTIPATGVPTYSWTWLVSQNGGPYDPATQCATESGTGASAGASETCSIAPGALTAGDTYNFELNVTDSSVPSVTTSSASSPTVSVASALTAPSTPTVNRPNLDVNQVLTVTGEIPTTGTALYSWEWLVSVNHGTFGTATQCASNSGTGAAAGATVTCTIAGGRLTVGDSYNFELQVTDGATVPETETSASSSTVTVASTLSAPGKPAVSATALDVDQALTITATIPTSGTPPYAWEWLVSVNGGSYVEATQCATPSGSGASGGTPETCSISGHTLTAGDHYTFKFKVGDSASASESATSSASAKVTVHSALTAPGAPTVSATTLPVTKKLSVKATIPTTGTAPYAWQWLVSVNGGGFSSATVCTTNSGTGGAGGAKITCTVPTNTLIVGDIYAFELRITDSATAAETQTSTTSPTVTVVV